MSTNFLTQEKKSRINANKKEDDHEKRRKGRRQIKVKIKVKIKSTQYGIHEIFVCLTHNTVRITDYADFWIPQLFLSALFSIINISAI